MINHFPFDESILKLFNRTEQTNSEMTKSDTNPNHQNGVSDDNKEAEDNIDKRDIQAK
jgi:hypothetical protein